MEIGQILGGETSPLGSPFVGLRTKKEYVCSPLKEDVQANIQRAKHYCRYVFDCGFMPIAPHIYFTLFLDDSIENERKKAMKFGLELLELCDELWVFGERISYGMSIEITRARELGMTVKYIKEASG